MAVLREPRGLERLEVAADRAGRHLPSPVCNIEHSVESRLDYRASMRRTTRAFPRALASFAGLTFSAVEIVREAEAGAETEGALG
jgi:hypothetical protein